ncbi:MAG: ABC transporter substrate-binding protein [Rhodospirillales bacterium]|nr:ABC transporter substrate-binding protein [Rhodospirillales bacterium]
MTSKKPRPLAACVLLFLGLVAFATARAEQMTLTLIYLARADDPFYEPHRAYTGLRLLDRHPALDGARLAIRDSRIIGRAVGMSFELLEHRLGAQEDASATVAELSRSGTAKIFLLDLPPTEMLAVADRAGSTGILLFNPREDDPELRGANCRPTLFHTMPSADMRLDALAQFARRRGWEHVLVLEGPHPPDRAMSAVFQASARKFGLDVVEVRPFVPGNDPRQRAQSNIALLTADADYDLVFLADSEGEFGRYVPYQTQRPRPVIGSEGLIAEGWHWTWERYGAPQLNQRFERLAGRRMQESDWASWAAVKAVVEAAVQSRSTDPKTLRATLLSPEFQFDGYKGTAVSFRPWNRQLRQPILLHTHNAVIARAPLEGFLHEINTLDTLGPDRLENNCAAE